MSVSLPRRADDVPGEAGSSLFVVFVKSGGIGGFLFVIWIGVSSIAVLDSRRKLLRYKLQLRYVNVATGITI